MKHLNIRLLRPYLIVFIMFFIVFNLLLALIYSIPCVKIEANVAQGLKVIEKEGLYLNLFPRVSERAVASDAFQLDLFTDRHMLRKLVPDNKSLSPWLASIEMNNYARYWHGYTIILRPLMAVFNYSQLRLLNIFLLFVLAVTSTILLAKYLNIYSAVALLMAFICIKLFIVPLCLAFSNMFYVFYLFLFIMLVLAHWKSEALFGSRNFSLYIFSLGIVTSFLDLLSTPLLPVGLLIAISCIWDYEKYNALPSPIKILRAFLLWCLGYVAMWLAKWILATILLDKNILLDAARSIIFTIHGETAQIKVDALSALKYNLLCAVSPFDALSILIIAGILVLLLTLLIMRGKLSLNKNFFAPYRLYFSLVFIGCIPFIWVLVIANHSQIHHFFTYRILCITMFSVSYILLKSIIFPKMSFKFNHSTLGDDWRDEHDPGADSEHMC